MRKIHELMGMMLPYYNNMVLQPFNAEHCRYFCDCAHRLFSENFISYDEMALVQDYIRKLINNEWSLSDMLFDDECPDTCTLEQQIQMVMFWINEIEILKEKNL